jgi:hypothetical protein
MNQQHKQKRFSQSLSQIVYLNFDKKDKNKIIILEQKNGLI